MTLIASPKHGRIPQPVMTSNYPFLPPISFVLLGPALAKGDSA